MPSSSIQPSPQRSLKAVKGFVRAAIGGLHLAVKEPARATEQVVNRMEGGSRDIELERLRAICATTF
jgi:NitT/TauT family transport system substrate-binding protein